VNIPARTTAHSSVVPAYGMPTVRCRESDTPVPKIAARFHGGTGYVAAECEVVGGSLAARGGEQLDHPERQADLGHLRGDRPRGKAAVACHCVCYLRWLV
jgi:hypothetical protein